ncbi:hypothetical protein D3C83_226460 [compost metagenome]
MIVGRLIPAGTGGQLRRFQKIAADRDAKLAIAREKEAAKKAALEAKAAAAAEKAAMPETAEPA